MTDELKPCPFCGDAMEWTVGDYLRHRVQTPGCPIAQNGFPDLTAWNRRADHSPDAGKMVADHIVDPNKMAAEPAGDLVERVANVLAANMTVLYGRPIERVSQDCARAILALFQPQMEAAVDVVRTAERHLVLGRLGTEEQRTRLSIDLLNSINRAKAIGIKGM